MLRRGKNRSGGKKFSRAQAKIILPSPDQFYFYALVFGGRLVAQNLYLRWRTDCKLQVMFASRLADNSSLSRVIGILKLGSCVFNLDLSFSFLLVCISLRVFVSAGCGGGLAFCDLLHKENI